MMDISIHAPRVGSDFAAYDIEQNMKIFQSTLPVWGATCYSTGLISAETLFQSTLPVWGATNPKSTTIPSTVNFNPRSPCGERPEKAVFCRVPYEFQSTLPVWGATEALMAEYQATYISIHAPRVGSDRLPRVWQAKANISIHAPRVGSDFPAAVNLRSP